MKRIVALVCILAMLVGLVAMVVTHSLAAPPKKGATLKTRGVSSRVRGDNPNIKTDHEKNDKNTKPPAPRAKGGKATRGTSEGILNIDNRTPWYLRIYVDGDYVGSVGPYGDFILYVPSGGHVIYAQATFEDGETLSFGPLNAPIKPDTTFTWTLEE